MKYSLFKTNENTYHVIVGKESTSMLSRYGVLEGKDIPITSSDILSANDTGVTFSAKRKLDVEVREGASGHTYIIPIRDGERIFGLGDANRDDVMIRGRRITLH